MYNVSRKAFQQIINIISNEDLETSDKAEAICQVIEEEINISNTTEKLRTSIASLSGVLENEL